MNACQRGVMAASWSSHHPASTAKALWKFCGAVGSSGSIGGTQKQAVPLEAEGVPYEEPRPKVGGSAVWVLRICCVEHTAMVAVVQPLTCLFGRARTADVHARLQASISRPAHLVDVSDLDPALPRRDVQRYSFVDDGFDLRITATLEEPVPLEAVRAWWPLPVMVCCWCRQAAASLCQRPPAHAPPTAACPCRAPQVRYKFAVQGLEVWAVGAAAAYRLHLPHLYGRVLPAKCAVRVRPGSCRLVVVLRKEADAAWPFLRGL